MFLSIRHAPTRRDAKRTTVINKDTGEPISCVIWANDETGRYRQYILDENGRYMVDREQRQVKSKIFTGNIELRIKE